MRIAFRTAPRHWKRQAASVGSLLVVFLAALGLGRQRRWEFER
jgi:hypothetical protein